MYYTIQGTSGNLSETQGLISRVDETIKSARAQLTKRIQYEIVTTHGSIDSLSSALHNVNDLDKNVIERWRQRSNIVIRNPQEYIQWKNTGELFIRTMKELAEIGISGSPSLILQKAFSQTKSDIVSLPKKAAKSYWPFLVGGVVLYVVMRLIFQPGGES